MTMRYVNLMVVTDSDNNLAQAAETLGRTASGLALDGMNVSISFGTPEED